jgi:hypothetical protein
MARKLDNPGEFNAPAGGTAALRIFNWDEGGSSAPEWCNVLITYRDQCSKQPPLPAPALQLDIDPFDPDRH